MSEKKRKLTLQDVEHVSERSYVLKLECMMCWEEAEFIGDTKEEALKEAEDDGWLYLESDQCQMEGFWCGCDYDDDED